MQELSKYFKLDIVDTNQTLKPIIIIEDSVTRRFLFTLTLESVQLNRTVELGDDLDDLDPISSLDKVSNIKVSSDYDSKKLKINTLRCSLYNYYDSKTKLSEYINTGIINKNIYLFYKSPTTNNINFGVNMTDYDCLLAFKGEISRIKFDDKKIDITAEDRTQAQIADKSVPYMAIDKLPTEISRNILTKYKSDNTVVPMTFGKVDKAPVLPYYENNNSKIMNLLFDIQPTAGHYKTSKIPSLTNMLPLDQEGGYPSGSVLKEFPISDYYLYIKDNNDYLIYDHIGTTLNNQYQHYSSVQVASLAGMQNNSIITGLSVNNDTTLFNLWDCPAFSQRMVEAVYAQDGSILDIYEFTTETGSWWGDPDLDTVNDNGGNEKIWYRDDDIIQSNSASFDTGSKLNYNANSDLGKGRWIVLKLDKGTSSKLLNITGVFEGSAGSYSSWAGNTWLLSDHIIYQEDDYESLPQEDSDGSSFNAQAGDHTGFIVAPIVPDLWNGLLTRINELNPFIYDQQTSNAKLMIMLLKKTENVEEIEQALDDEIVGNELYDIIESLSSGWIEDRSTNNASHNSGSYGKRGAISLSYTENYSGSTSYWGNRGANNGLNYTGSISNIEGMFYGDFGWNLGQLLTAPANSFDDIAIFEYKTLSESTWKSGLKMNNCAFLQSVLAEKIDEKNIYASIIGRKNNMYTEELNAFNFDMFPDQTIPFNYYITGEDGQLPNFELLIEEAFNVIKETYLRNFSWDTDNDGGVSSDRGSFQRFIFSEDWNERLKEQFEIYMTDDSPMSLSYSFFKQYIWKHFISFAKLYYEWGAEIAAADIGNYESREYTPEEDYYWKVYYLAESPFDETDITTRDDNYRWLFTEASFVKPILQNIYSYLYQTNISLYNTTTVQYRTLDYLSGDYDIYLTIDKDDQVDLDLTISQYRDYDYTIAGEINSIEDWKESFYLYMDDYFSAVIQSLITNVYEGIHKPAYDSFQLGMGNAIGPNDDDDTDGLTYNPYWNITFNSNWFGLNGWAYGMGNSDISGFLMDQIIYDLTYIATLSIEEEPIIGITTDGIIQKPSDIVMSILVNEMEFNKYAPEQGLFQPPEEFAGSILKPDYNQFDMDSIIFSRNIHSNWKMGFSVDKKTNGKKLIEEILKESKSYPKFTSNGKFSLINIREQYIYDDIDKIIEVNDIIKYKFNQSKREDILTSLKMFYRYDYGFKKYTMSNEIHIEDLLPEYDGYDYYNITSIDTHKDINLKYHTDNYTVEDFSKYTLLNSCNPHNEVVLELPLKYMELTVGDVIHLPLINNEKIFNIDYSQVQILNGQPIYPLWIILSTDMSSTNIKIKAYQLHYLGIDGNHGFSFPNESVEIVGNRKELNSTYTFPNGDYIPNWNYNPNATVDSGVEIPYYDINGDGNIDVTDIQLLFNYVIGLPNSSLTDAQKERLTFNSPNIDTVTCVAMVNIIVG
tara:strand:+ start:7731 stop:12071 length:4341 start_codon:yes stop_codon:yes gene_type:complete